MSHKQLTLVIGLAGSLTTASVQAEATAPWLLTAPVSASVVSGGPWTLGQSAAPAHQATLGSPRQGMCNGGSLSLHSGTDLMQPYYFPLTWGDDKHMNGLFDYRVKDNEELLASAVSSDGGRSWQVTGTALQLNDGLCGASNLTDNGQGHATLLTIDDIQHVYTLDRAATPSFLLEHTLSPQHGDLLAGLPASEPVSGNTVPGGAVQVLGLVEPDGIVGVVPGFRVAGEDHEDAVEVLYLSKRKGFFASAAAGACPSDAASTAQLAALGKKPNQDLAEMHLAHTIDGVSFVDDGAVTFDKINPKDSNMAFTSTRFIGPRGTIVRYKDGSYGLFFSGGNCGDGDSDAYHYIGYAHSADARHWVVDNDISNPLVSVDYANLGSSDALRHHYTGRVYSPTVTFEPNGKTATMLFSGYNTPQPLPSTKTALGFPTANYQPTTSQSADYRTIMRVTLTRGSAPQPALGEREMEGRD